MADHAQRARELFEQGYNCAQAVFAAFSDETGMEEVTALKLSSSFGGGIGKLREVCGAVSGAAMVLGIKYGYADPKADAAKAEHYRLVQAYAKRFKEENGSFICRDLVGTDCDGNPVPQTRTKDYYESRPCAGLVESAARLLDETLEAKAAVGQA